MSEQATSQPTATVSQFDPGHYLTKVNGADYLEVKWRPVWFRDVYPQGRIETDLLHYDEQRAMFKATVTAIRDGEMLGVATGHGDETSGDFRDFATKAETKAIGRALAALGFGTQFTYEFADAGDGRVADAPVRAPSGNLRSFPAPAGGGSAPRGGGGAMSKGPATDKQRGFIESLLRELQMTDLMVADLVAVTTGDETMEALSRQGASKLIEALQQRRATAAPAMTRAVSPHPETPQLQPAAPVTGGNGEDSQAAAFAASAQWSEGQRAWVSRILRASDGHNLDGIAAAMPRTRDGQPDQQLSDLVALRRAEVPA